METLVLLIAIPFMTALIVTSGIWKWLVTKAVQLLATISPLLAFKFLDNNLEMKPFMCVTCMTFWVFIGMGYYQPIFFVLAGLGAFIAEEIHKKRNKF